jgi:hypothetical protein
LLKVLKLSLDLCYFNLEILPFGSVELAVNKVFSFSPRDLGVHDVVLVDLVALCQHRTCSVNFFFKFSELLRKFGEVSDVDKVFRVGHTFKRFEFFIQNIVDLEFEISYFLLNVHLVFFFDLVCNDVKLNFCNVI